MALGINSVAGIAGPFKLKELFSVRLQAALDRLPWVCAAAADADETRGNAGRQPNSSLRPAPMMTCSGPAQFRHRCRHA